MGKKKDKENQVPGDPKKKRCRWNTESDALFIGQLTAEKAAENRTHNAGWHQAAFTACSRVLAGSEKKSGGAAKTADACVTRWGTVCPSFLPCSLLLIFLQLKAQYQIVKTLRNKSGWRWDDENKHIVVEDSVWEAAVEVPTMSAWSV